MSAADKLGKASKPAPPMPAVKPSADGAAQKVDAAVRHIEEARKLNETLQKQYAPDSASYAHCEQIDDKLFDALKALGN